MERGEVLALVGESGSGKSTIARGLSGLIAPLAGRILLEGQVLAPLIGARPPALRRRIQYVFQNPDASLNPRMRIGAILARPLKVFYRLDAAAARARIERGLDDV